MTKKFQTTIKQLPVKYNGQFVQQKDYKPVKKKYITDLDAIQEFKRKFRQIQDRTDDHYRMSMTVRYIDDVGRPHFHSSNK